MRHLCKEVTKMEFGVLNFFEHPAGGKTEHRIFKEQLDTLRAAHRHDLLGRVLPFRHSRGLLSQLL